ncbi:MAG: hypothetical protein COA47_09305 [Robiginitomaculum sp.]|nr:MAG: hypothetical protein COA47_09305 [Robiginitomaculum sp.]
MNKFTKTREAAKGFTLLETLIALLLAASGLAMVFESMSGAAKLHAAGIELAQTNMLAENIMAQSRIAGPGAGPTSGISDQIAWNVRFEPIASNQNDLQLIRIRVLASGPSGREVRLVSEKLQATP